MDIDEIMRLRRENAELEAEIMRSSHVSVQGIIVAFQKMNALDTSPRNEECNTELTICRRGNHLYIKELEEAR